MLYNYEGADGVKTGYTKEAGRCLVTSATRENMRLVSVVLNSPSMYERSGELLDSCFAKYSVRHIYGKTEYELPSDVPEKLCRCVCEKELYYPLAEGEEKVIAIKVQLPSALKLPVYKGENVGSVKITFQNQLIFSEKIVSIVDMEKSYFDILREIAKNLRLTR